MYLESALTFFDDFEIETVSNVLSLLFKMDEQVNMTFEAEKDEEGYFLPETIEIFFKNRPINKKPCTFLKAKQLHEKIENEQIKNHLVDDNIVAKKGV